MLDKMMRRRSERIFRQKLGPHGIVARVALFDEAGLDGAMRRVVAGEMAGIDIESMDMAGHCQTDDRPVMTRNALAAALPAIHPLAVFIIFARQEDRRVVLQHAGQRREEIIRGIKAACAKTRRGEIDRALGKIGNEGGFGFTHVILLEASFSVSEGQCAPPARRRWQTLPRGYYRSAARKRPECRPWSAPSRQ